MASDVKRSEDAGGEKGVPEVASQHPGLPPSLDKIEEMEGLQEAGSMQDIRMRKGGLAKHNRSMTLKDLAGEYSGLTHLPKERSQHQNSSPIPIIRWGAVFFWIARQNLGTFAHGFKRTMYKLWMNVAWVLSLLWWQLSLGLIVSLISLIPSVRERATSALGQERVEELTDIHGILGGVIGFVLGFRVNMAYQAYMEGRRLVGQLMNGLREVVVDCYAVVPRGGAAAAAAAAADSSGKDAGALLEAAREIRRLCNVLFAFVRQDVRESKCGFIPGSDLENSVKFDPANTYHMDPCRPRLWDLLREEETVRYSKIPSRMRPCAVVLDIMEQIEVIERNCSKAPSPRGNVGFSIKSVLAAHESMARLTTCRVPYPFICILQISVFLFIFNTPFYYLSHTRAFSTLSAMFFLILAYYGLFAVADTMERPFAYTHGSFQIALESFGLKTHDDLLDVARLWAGDEMSFVPEYLTSEAAPRTKE